MKKLQINYTNASQSGRLLNMGVPAWSADCTQEKEQGGSFWQHKWIKHEWNNDYNAKDYQKFLDREKDTLPCWSAGRLIEIYITCIEHYTGDERLTFGQDTVRCGMIDCIIAAIEVACNDRDIDFSKLDE